MDQRQVPTSNNGSAFIELDVNELLKHIKNIFQVEFDGESRQEAFKVYYEKKISQEAFTVSYELINKISNKIWCDCEKGYAKPKATSLLNLLTYYSPDEKVVLVLASIAVRYGDLMVIMNQQTNDQLVGESISKEMVNSLVSLKELKIGTLPGESTLKPQIQTIKDIKDTVKTVLRVVHIIMELKGFHTWNEIINESHIDGIIFWMVTAVIHCGFTVSEFYSGYSLILNEKSELEDAKNKIEQYHQELERDIFFYRRREEKMHYRKLSDLIEDGPASNIDILYYFISSSIDEKILYHHGSKEQTTLRSFEKHNVLILYSSFATETFQYELSLLKRFYNNTNTENGCKIVWIPIPITDEKTTINENSYMEVISEIPCCYTLTYEAIQKVNCGLVHLLEKDWGFTGKPMLVVLDERGRVVRQNALLMLDAYGNDAFPFTTEQEKQLLATKYRGMQLLLPDTDAIPSQWKKSKEQYICLYGGDEMDRFELINEYLESISKKVNIKVVKAYVGTNSHDKEKVGKNLASFKGKNLGYSMDYLTSIEFWKRLQKFVLHFSTQASSKVTKNFLSWAGSLVMLDKSCNIGNADYADNDTWVAIGNADNVVVSSGIVFSDCLSIKLRESKKWESTVTTDNFLEKLSKWLDDDNKKLGYEKHCHKLEIAGSPALIKGDMKCPTCNKKMQLMMMYKCCNTEN